MTYCLKMPLLNCIMGKNESILLIILLLRENYSFPAPFCGLRDLFNFDKEKRQCYTTICLKNHHSRLLNLLLRYLLKVNVQYSGQTVIYPFYSNCTDTLFPSFSALFVSWSPKFGIFLNCVEQVPLKVVELLW